MKRSEIIDFVRFEISQLFMLQKDGHKIDNTDFLCSADVIIKALEESGAVKKWEPEDE